MVVDLEAKDTLENPISNCGIPYTFIIKYVLKSWKDRWPNWDKQLDYKIARNRPLSCQDSFVLHYK